MQETISHLENSFSRGFGAYIDSEMIVQLNTELFSTQATMNEATIESPLVGFN